MKVEHINPFLKAITDTLKSTTGLTFNKGKITLIRGIVTEGKMGVLYHYTGEISGILFVDFSEPLYNYIKNLKVEENPHATNETKDPVDLITGLISKKSMEFLSNSGLNCSMDAPHRLMSGEKSSVSEDLFYIYIPLTHPQYGFINLRLAGTAQSYFNNDGMLCYGIGNNLFNKVVVDFVPLGFVVFNALTKKQIEMVVQSRKIDFLILNDDASFDIYKDLSLLVTTSLNPHLQFIIYTDTPLDYLAGMGMDKVSIIGALDKKMTEEELIVKLKEIVSKIGIKTKERRSEIRYYFDHAEHATVDFLIQGQMTALTADLVNISVGGMMVRLHEHDEALKTMFKPKTEFRRVSIRITDLQQNIITNGIVSYQKGNLIGIQFSGMIPKSASAIVRYINDRTTYMTF